MRQTDGNTGMLFNIALNYGGRAEIVDAARRAIAAGHPSGRSRRAAVRRVSLHGRSARSRSADPHERRDAGEQLPAVADRVRRNLGDRNAVAGLPPARICSRPSSPTRSAIAGTAASSRRESGRARRQVTRVLSGAVLLVFAIAVVWFAPSRSFLRSPSCCSCSRSSEYATLARTAGLPIPAVPSGLAAMLTCAAFAPAMGVPLDVVLMSAFVALAALHPGDVEQRSPGRRRSVSPPASLLPVALPGLADRRDDRHSRDRAAARRCSC